MSEVIGSFTDCRRFVAADASRMDGSYLHVLLRNPQCRWLLRLRITEWVSNTQGGPFGGFLRWRLQARGLRLGYTIPINRLGPGIRLPHWGTIVINGGATVGSGCQISVDVVIGGNNNGVPSIGNDVFISPGVKIIGKVRVGDGAILLPGAVVIDDVPSREMWGGVPAVRKKTLTDDHA